jgi:hypothetical protein
MESKEQVEHIEAESQKSRAELERIHEKDGYYDGKLFYSKDRVTYTFVSKGEVISLHLDLLRNALFLKGHRISTFEDHSNLAEFLSRFKKCLLDNAKTKKFVPTYDTIVSGLCEIS